MAKKLSATERIKRHLLKKGIDYPADQVVAELALTGFHTNNQMVYNVRSNMKQAAVKGEPVKPIVNGYTPKADNEQTLSTHILNAVKDKNLSVAEITAIVKKDGFNSNSQNFVHSVRMECERMMNDGKLEKSRERDGSVFYGVKAAIPAPVAAVVIAPVAEPEPTKSVEPPVVATALGIESVNLGDLLSVQRLVRQIGGANKLQQHVALLAELEAKPASEMLETFAKLTTAGAS